MGSPRLTIQLVTWNNKQFLPYFFASLAQQTFTDWELVVADNASTDGTLEFLQTELPKFNIPHRLILNADNKGFSGGHNQLFAQGNNEYILLANPDLLLPPDCLESLVSFLDSRKDVAVVTPLLMKWNFAKMIASGNIGDGFTTIIDSFGLEIKRNRRVVEKLGGTNIDPAEFRSKVTAPIQIFGASGAMFLARRASLKQVLLNGQLFDESYGSYKEDIDLAYRLNAAGFTTYVLPTCTVYHARGAGANGLSDQAAAKNKVTQSAAVRRNSYRNHLYNLYKNEAWQNLALDFSFILWYELKKFVWFLLFDRPTLRGLKDLWHNRKVLRINRAFIKKMRTTNWRNFRKYVV